jgi:hypothetical protein
VVSVKISGIHRAFRHRLKLNVKGEKEIKSVERCLVRDSTHRTVQHMSRSSSPLSESLFVFVTINRFSSDSDSESDISDIGTAKSTPKRRRIRCYNSTRIPGKWAKSLLPIRILQAVLVICRFSCFSSFFSELANSGNHHSPGGSR